MIVAACLSWKSDSFVALSGSTFYSKIIVHLIFLKNLSIFLKFTYTYLHLYLLVYLI